MPFSTDTLSTPTVSSRHHIDPLLLREPWYTRMSLTSYCFLIGLPIGSFFFIIFLLRVVWKPKEPKYRVPKDMETGVGSKINVGKGGNSTTTKYGTTQLETSIDQETCSPNDSIISSISQSPISSSPSPSSSTNEYNDQFTTGTAITKSNKGNHGTDDKNFKFFKLGAHVQKTISADAIHPGMIAGTYEAKWTETFDFVFLNAMIGFLGLLIFLTTFYKPELWLNVEFWIYMIPKILIMMSVSLFGGLLCQYFCIVDEKGYIIATKVSKFKVNYTRKLQHLAAYIVPLIMKPSSQCNCNGPLELAWSDFFTLIGFLVLIKPLREKFKFFMLQFNSLDRPEDRPHTLNWIVVGNIVPGLILLLFFRWLFNESGQANLVFIIVFITGIGDGLAEPIGISFGKHKYSTRSCLSKRKYTRSYEGSACVFLSGMVFPALQYRSFATPMQLWLSMLLLPPIVAYAEATAPHTMDTPVLMTLTGLVLYAIIQIC